VEPSAVNLWSRYRCAGDRREREHAVVSSGISVTRIDALSSTSG
jgi:hypothetical protein